MTDTAEVRVEQRHREAAARFINMDEPRPAGYTLAHAFARFESSLREDAMAGERGRCAAIVDLQREKIQQLFVDRFEAGNGHVENADCIAYGDMICEALATAIRSAQGEGEK